MGLIKTFSASLWLVIVCYHLIAINATIAPDFTFPDGINITADHPPYKQHPYYEETRAAVFVRKNIFRAHCKSAGFTAWKAHSTDGDTALDVTPIIPRFDTRVEEINTDVKSSLSLQWDHIPRTDKWEPYWDTDSEIVVSVEPFITSPYLNSSIVWKRDVRNPVRGGIYDIAEPEEIKLTAKVHNLLLSTELFLGKYAFTYVNFELPVGPFRFQLTVMINLRDVKTIGDLFPRIFFTGLLDIPTIAGSISSYGFEFEPLSPDFRGLHCTKIVVEGHH